MTENLTKRANDLLGDSDIQLLEEVVSLLKDMSGKREVSVRLKPLEKKIESGNADIKSVLSEIRTVLKDSRIEIPDVQKVHVDNQIDIPSEVSVKNFPKYPEVKIPEFPDEISTKEPSWLAKYFDFLGKSIKAESRRTQKVVIDGNGAKNPLAVRLTDGKSFYEAVAGAISNMTKSNFPFKTAGGEYQEALVNSDGSIVMDVRENTNYEGGPVTVGTTAVEMTFSGVTNSISIRSDSSNTGSIWIGPSTIDNTGANAVDKIDAGGAKDFDLNDASAPIYAVSDVAGQRVYKFALTS